LEIIWKQTVILYYYIIFWHLSGGTEYNHEDRSLKSVIRSEIRIWDLQVKTKGR